MSVAEPSEALDDEKAGQGQGEACGNRARL
jgi:hypothetical protein